MVPRRRRFCPAGIPVHVIQRGNNRQTLFNSDKDIVAYANWLAEGAIKFDLHVHGWVFMTNHVHLLVTPMQSESVSLLMQFLGRLYVRYFNYSYARSGTLFEGRFRSSLVQEEEYFLACLRYIELNPIRAGMVTDPGDYRWSSYRAHGFGIRMRLWEPHAVYLSLGDDIIARQKAYRGLMSELVDLDVIAKIRHCANTGLVLGSEKFRKQVAIMVG
jgi:putative transposase